MKTTERFEKAVKVLYNAFHENKLNPYDCKACAVGNMLGHGLWQGHGITTNDKKEMQIREFPGMGAIRFDTFGFGFMEENQEKDYSSYYGQTMPVELRNNSGYSREELFNIEYKFLKAFEGSREVAVIPFEIVYENKKEDQFEGLCSVVKYLAKLDNIPNPMDYTKLFETDEVGKAKYKLTV